MDEIPKIVDHLFQRCEICGYQKGFHIILEPIRFSERTTIKLLCPNCGQIYDVGWSTRLET